MTREEALKRNQVIFRLRGVPEFDTLIEGELRTHFSSKDMECLRKANEILKRRLDEAKIKHYTCSKCMDVSNFKIAKSKKAFICDICGTWINDTDDGKMYVIPKDKR